jgi:broad-specificity NMP kinase
MPSDKKKLRERSKKIKKLQRVIIASSISSEKYAHLVHMLNVACGYCNNLENHLKSRGYDRRKIETIKHSTS